jgi:hypothetical protein
MKETCDFPAFTAHRLGDEVLHIEMKKVKKLFGKDVEQIYDCHLKIGKGKDIYLLVTFQGYIPMSDDAMAEAKKQGKSHKQAAAAYVVENSAIRMGIKFFINFYKPNYPIIISAKKSEAISWLLQQKNGNKK